MSNKSDPLLGKKTTLNRLAVKLEFSWQLLRDLVSSKRKANVPGRNDRKVVSKTNDEGIEALMMEGVVVCVLTKRYDVMVCFCCCPLLRIRLRRLCFVVRDCHPFSSAILCCTVIFVGG